MRLQSRASVKPITPQLSHAFSTSIDVGTPIELGVIDGGSERFVPILGSKVHGSRLTGVVLAAGCDWQKVRSDGRAKLLAK